MPESPAAPLERGIDGMDIIHTQSVGRFVTLDGAASSAWERVSEASHG